MEDLDCTPNGICFNAMKKCVFISVSVQFSSFSAVKCPTLDVSLSHCPPLVYVLRDTVTVFSKTIQTVPPSRPWSSSVPCVSPGRPERNAAQRLSIRSSRHMTSAIPFEFTYRFHGILDLDIGFLGSIKLFYNQATMFIIILSRALCTVLSFKVCCFVRFQVSDP